MTAPRSASSTIMRMTLAWCGIVTTILAVLGALFGYLYAGIDGLWSALVGVVLAAVFLGMTALSILIAGRAQGPDQLTLFFGIVVGAWILKLIIFVVVMLLLRGQPWIEGTVFLVAVIVSVLASLVVDAVVLSKARVPYTGDVALPESSEGGAHGPGRS
ncbi:MAG: hypothetical protein ACK5IN_05920 [Microbacterium sp.]